MLTRAQSQLADQYAIKQLGIPSVVLMENAGRGCAEQLRRMGAQSVVICCGSGNNGGDGFVIARHLFNAGIPVKVILLSEPETVRGDAASNLRIIEKLPIPIVQFDPNWTETQLIEHFTSIGRISTDWVVDAILGTGASGPLRHPLDRLIPFLNQLPAKRLAVDLPTGLDCDTGTVHSEVFQADVTCAMIAAKTGFANPNAAICLGHVTVIDIGIQSELIQPTDASGDPVSP